MTNKEKLKRKINELVGGNYPITIGRIMQAVGDRANIRTNIEGYVGDMCLCFIEVCDGYSDVELFNWKLTKDNGQEATLDDQSEEVINELLELFN